MVLFDLATYYFVIMMDDDESYFELSQLDSRHGWIGRGGQLLDWKRCVQRAPGSQAVQEGVRSRRPQLVAARADTGLVPTTHPRASRASAQAGPNSATHAPTSGRVALAAAAGSDDDEPDGAPPGGSN